MKIRIFNKHILAVLFLIVGMSVTSQNFSDRSDAANRKRTAPDNCKITAKIIRVIPAWRKISKKTCEKAPCVVKLKVVKIDAYGSAFPLRFSEGQKMTVNFACPIVDGDSETNRSYSLKKGNLIDAVLTARPVINSNEHNLRVSFFSVKE